jgi:hypothetical protein
MAKAVIPMQKFREKFGENTTERLSVMLQELVVTFLHEGEKDRAKARSDHELSTSKP